MSGQDPQYLVSTDWLSDHLDDPQLRIFDCTGRVGTADFRNHGRESHYNLHHIPGAAYLDVANPKGELSDADARLPFTWPRPDTLGEAIGALGISHDSYVVVYAGPNADTPNAAAVGQTWATRAWWLLHHAGVDVAVLDGGWSKWESEGRPISTEPATYKPSKFVVNPDMNRGLATKDDVLEAVTKGSAGIIDSLSPQSYRGEQDTQYGSFGTRRGHITNAVNVYFESLIDPATGCFLDRDALRERFAASGIGGSGRVITYCGGGIGATMTGLGLKLAGRDDVAVYDASMMEWNGDPDLPMTDPSVQ